MNSLSMWWKHVKIKLIMRMAYRTEFFIALLAMATLEFVGPIIAYTIYYNSPGFVGWTLYDILLLQGILMTLRGIGFSCLMGIVWNSNIKLREGTFDLILLKPRNALFMFMCDSFDSEDWIKVFGGAALIGVAVHQIGGITFASVGIAIVVSIFALLLMLSLGLFMSAFIFRFIQTWRIYELLDILMMVGQYPKSIYPRAIQTIFTGIIPIFIASVFPTQALLGTLRSDVFISMGAVIIILTIAIKAWYGAIKNYASAGG